MLPASINSIDHQVASAQETGQGIKLHGLASEVLSDDPIGWSAAYLLRRAPHMLAHGLRSCNSTSPKALKAGGEAPTLDDYRRALLSLNSNDASTTASRSSEPGNHTNSKESTAHSSAKKMEALSTMVLPNIDVEALAPEVVAGLDKLAVDLLPGGALCGFRFLAPTARPSLGPWLTLGPAISVAVSASAASATSAAPTSAPGSTAFSDSPQTIASTSTTAALLETPAVLAPPSLAGGGTVDTTVVCLAAPVELVVYERLSPEASRSLLDELRLRRRNESSVAASFNLAAPSPTTGRKRSREEGSDRNDDSNNGNGSSSSDGSTRNGKCSSRNKFVHGISGASEQDDDAPWEWPCLGTESVARVNAVENAVSGGNREALTITGKEAKHQVFQLHAGDGAFIPKGCIYALRAFSYRGEETNVGAVSSNSATSTAGAFLGGSGSGAGSSDVGCSNRSDGKIEPGSAKWCGVVWWHSMHLGEGKAGDDGNVNDTVYSATDGKVGTIKTVCSDSAQTAPSTLAPSISSSATARSVAAACEVALAFAKEGRLRREPTLGLPEQVIMQATRANLSSIIAQDASTAYNNLSTPAATGSALTVAEPTSHGLDSHGSADAIRRMENPFQFWVDSANSKDGSFSSIDSAAATDGGLKATNTAAPADVRPNTYVDACIEAQNLATKSRALLAGLLPSATTLLSRDEIEATAARRTIAHALHVEKVEADAAAAAATTATARAAAAAPAGMSAGIVAGTESNTGAVTDDVVAAAAAAADAAAAAVAGSVVSSEWSAIAHSDVPPPPPPQPVGPTPAVSAIVDAFVAPDSLNAVEPFSCEGFSCQMCGAEAANSYLHCAGCESLLGADFNLCPSCYNDITMQDIARRCSNSSRPRSSTTNSALKRSLGDNSGCDYKAMSTQRFHIVPRDEVRRWSSTFQSDGRCTNDMSMKRSHYSGASSSVSSLSTSSLLITPAPLVHRPCKNCGACDHCACRCHATFQVIVIGWLEMKMASFDSHILFPCSLSFIVLFICLRLCTFCSVY